MYINIYWNLYVVLAKQETMGEITTTYMYIYMNIYKYNMFIDMYNRLYISYT
jgi:hypothetical protein